MLIAQPLFCASLMQIVRGAAANIRSRPATPARSRLLSHSREEGGKGAVDRPLLKRKAGEALPLSDWQPKRWAQEQRRLALQEQQLACAGSS